VLARIAVLLSSSSGRRLKVPLDAELDGEQLCYYGLTPHSNGIMMNGASEVREVCSSISACRVGNGCSEMGVFLLVDFELEVCNF
jgi:hypothetical protein